MKKIIYKGKKMGKNNDREKKRSASLDGKTSEGKVEAFVMVRFVVERRQVDGTKRKAK